MTEHHIFADLNISTMQEEVIEFLPFIVRNFVLKPVIVCFVVQDTKMYCFAESGTECEHNHE